jgi:uncharacterized protein DUF2798
VRPAISLRIRNPCQNAFPALNRSLLSVPITWGRDYSGRVISSETRFFSGSCAEGIQWKARPGTFFPVMISALIVFVVSGVVTFSNIGLRAGFVPRWLKAFAPG